MKFEMKRGIMNFHIEKNYDWKNHKPIYQIWRYDPNACAIYRACTYPFCDIPNFDSFIQAVKYLKENLEDIY